MMPTYRGDEEIEMIQREPFAVTAMRVYKAGGPVDAEHVAIRAGCARWVAHRKLRELGWRKIQGMLDECVWIPPPEAKK